MSDEPAEGAHGSESESVVQEKPKRPARRARAAVEPEAVEPRTSSDPGSNSVPASAYPLMNEVSTPSVPATTVTATNSNGYDVTVVLVGPTVTDVKVDGASVGAGSGTYVVPAGKTIALTYATGTPTWTWNEEGGVGYATNTFTNGAAEPGD